MNGEMTKKWYWPALIAISAITSVLIHLPELISLWGGFDNHNISPESHPAEVFSEITFSFLSLLFLYAVNIFIFKFQRINSRIKADKLILSFILSFVISMVLNNAFYMMHMAMDLPAVHTAAHHYIHPLRDFIISIIVVGSCYIIYLFNKQQQIIVENHQLRAENFRNQYETLKNQLNPHMLFNSLNTLRSLIREEPAKAQEYTQELSDVLRYMLQCNESPTVKLSDELEFTEAYIYLLKMRYEDNLIFEIAIDRQYLDYLIPPTTLQHLIENAVKHNEISIRHPFVIRLYTSCNDFLMVSNPIQPKLNNPPGTGTGLDNLARRYRLLFHKEIEIHNESDIFSVHIPLIDPRTYESADR